ncbi:MAG: sugar ABC transporter permease, partial [Candidatus Omnitrophica bacterium]|nr:sugar ABC transporter permease [Candidatus Omnitrophota bacterium]
MNKKCLGVILILPALLVFAVLVWGPIIANFLLSFFSWDILTPPKFVGLDNYASLFKDQLLWKYMGNTFFYFIEAGIIFLLVMLMVSLAGKTSKDVQSRIRILYLIPAVAFFPVAYALIWRWLFNPDFGLINMTIAGLGKFLHIPLRGPDWLSSTIWAKPAMAIYNICT